MTQVAAGLAVCLALLVALCMSWRVHLKRRLERAMKSSNQTKRLTIAAAIVAGHDVDLSRLDQAERNRVRARIKKLRRVMKRQEKEAQSHGKATTDP